MRKKRVITIGVIVMIVLLAAAGALYVFVINRPASGDVPAEHTADAGSLPENSAPIPIEQQLQENNQEVIKVELKPVTIAIYGSDARSDETSRSDVIMVLKYNPGDNSITMVSIPRDSRVEIPGRGPDKINHAYAFGGADLMTQTIEDLLETEIDYYFLFSFDDFSTIIDILGGVKVNAEKDFMYDEDEVRIPQGPVTLNGEDALYYVRFRSDEEGDYGRIRRQQEVIQSIYEKLFRSDMDKIRQILIKLYAENVETNISFDQLLNYDTLLDNRTEITFHKYMLENSGKIIDKIWYGIIDEESLAAIKETLSQ